MTTFHIISLFPESFESYLKASIIGRAQKEGHIAVKYYNPRDFALPRKVEEKADLSIKEAREMTYAERRVDDRPYGGGPGMVIEAMPVIRAIESAIIDIRNRSHAVIPPLKKGVTPPRRPAGRRRGISNFKILFFIPSGEQFTNQLADKFKKYSDIILVCGRYEGIDARVKKAFPMIEISVGPYTLTGGELPAMAVIDAITRRMPGVLGHDSSVEERRVAGPDVYTRPEVVEFKGKKLRVPKILLSGHHANIDGWKASKKKPAN